MNAKDQRDLRDLYHGLDDGLSQAIEMVLTPGLFALIGYWIDSRLGLVPWFTVSLLLLALVGVFTRMWARYAQEMEAHERRAEWGQRPPEAAR